jgi:phosphatidylserine/phosphatidylglycerophosphate/cardiolipin synthase-like enzyme
MRYLPILLIALFAAVLFAGCVNTTPPVTQAATSVYTLGVEPNDGRAMVLDTINGSQKTLTLTIYELDDPQVIDALAAAQKRGVAVRVLYNNASFASMNETNPNLGAVHNLTPLGVAMKPASPVFTVTHQKTLTVDGTRSLIMTFNLEPEYFGTTRDFGILTTNATEVREIADVFDADWNYQNITPSVPTLVWSPVNSREKILRVINGSTKTLEVYNEEISDQQCIDALIAAAQRGVVVRVIAADLEGNDGRNENAPALQGLNANGVQAKAITSLYIHAKMALADYNTTGQIVYIGSENFSNVSLDQNRELGILVTEKPILDRLESVFSQDWQVPAMKET